MSLIVCAKNEALNLETNIPLWLDQVYPSFELIVVNHSSVDQTKTICEKFEALDSRLRLIQVNQEDTHIQSKKQALSLGVYAARYEHLVFTDADCSPASGYWLQGLASLFTIKTDLILGYGAYQKIKGSFLNKLIRFETLVTAMQYFNYALWGNPYMGVGRNMAYTKSLFLKNNGFATHSNIQSGDDDLFVNQTATSKNTQVQLQEHTFTISVPKTSLKSWIRQKRRHITTATHYKLRDQLLLGGYAMSQVLFFVVALIALLNSQFLLAAVGVIITRYMVTGIAIAVNAKKLKEPDLIFYYPILEFVLLCFQGYIFSVNIFSKPKQWK